MGYWTGCGKTGGGKQRRKRGKRTWCKHLLITFCRIDTHTSYSVTECEAVGTTVCECMRPLTCQAAATCTSQLGVTLVRLVTCDNIRMCHGSSAQGGNWDIKRNMEHILPQAFTFTNPLSAHSHNICPALFILKSIHISQRLFVYGSRYK